MMLCFTSVGGGGRDLKVKGDSSLYRDLDSNDKLLMSIIMGMILSLWNRRILFLKMCPGCGHPHT